MLVTDEKSYKKPLISFINFQILPNFGVSTWICFCVSLFCKCEYTFLVSRSPHFSQFYSFLSLGSWTPGKWARSYMNAILLVPPCPPCPALWSEWSKLLTTIVKKKTTPSGILQRGKHDVLGSNGDRRSSPGCRTAPQDCSWVKPGSLFFIAIASSTNVQYWASAMIWTSNNLSPC